MDKTGLRDGDSMDKTGLRDGDTVAIQATPEARHGQIVVARFDDEVTLKRLIRQKAGYIELRPESYNEKHKPILVDLSKTQLYIDGIAVGALIGGLADGGYESNEFA